MVMKIRRRTIMMAVALAAALAGAGVAVANAATATGQPSGTRVSGVSSSGPRINWDSPLPGGRSSSMRMARADGRLPFSPTMPQFGIGPRLVQVSNPADTGTPDLRTVAFVYYFPIGKAFPVDGRVSVLEYQTKVTEKQLEAVAANPPGPAEDFTVIRINGHGALLVHANGIGRVMFVLHGVMYDLTGPAVSPQEAEHLARQIRPA
jgi:hypothetical protein